MSDTDRARHFKANGLFFVDASFDAALPRGAYPVVELTGPSGSGSPTTLSTASSSPENWQHPDLRFIRLAGNVPSTAAPGTYTVTRFEMQWVVGSPPSWKPVDIPFAHLGEDATIIVDPADAPPQPPVPTLTDLD